LNEARAILADVEPSSEGWKAYRCWPSFGGMRHETKAALAEALAESLAAFLED
jgi:hypothetical protein